MSRIIWVASRSLHDHLHGFIVIPSDLEIGDPAIALGCGDMGMSQKILDGGERGIGVQELCREGMSQAMRRHV